jgi:hypothetical protein
MFVIRLMVIQLGFSVLSLSHAHDGHGAVPSNLFFHYFVDGWHLGLLTVLFVLFSCIQVRRWFTG